MVALEPVVQATGMYLKKSGLYPYIISHNHQSLQIDHILNIVSKQSFKGIFILIGYGHINQGNIIKPQFVSNITKMVYAKIEPVVISFWIQSTFLNRYPILGYLSIYFKFIKNN